jgi:predicted MFS family arabinose efflux permease
MKEKFQFHLLLIISFLVSIAVSGTRPILSIHAHELGASPFYIGLLVSAFALFPLFLAIRIGKWIDRFGSRTLILVGGAGIIMSLMVAVLFPTLLGLLFSQIFIGLFNNCLVTSTQKRLSLTKGNRDKAVSGLSTVYSAGDFVAPLVGGILYEHAGFQTTFMFLAVTQVLLLAFGRLLISEVQKKDEKQQSGYSTNTFGLLKDSHIRKGVLISGVVVYSKDIFTAYFPVLAAGHGFSPSQIGIVLSCVAAASVMVRLIQFKLVKWMDREKLISVALLLGAVAFTVTSFLGNRYALSMTAIALGAGLGLVQPLSMVYLMQHTPKGREGEVLGLRSMLNRSWQLSGPLLLGLVGNSFGLLPVFWSCGLTLFCGSWYSKPKSVPIHLIESPGQDK